MAGKEKSILLNIVRATNPLEKAQTLEDLNSGEGRNLESYQDSWYIMELTADGPKISEIFGKLRRGQPNFWLYSASSAIVGSFFYIIGGSIHTNLHSGSSTGTMSNIIHRLDINNPADGWKYSTIPFHLSNVPSQVLGNYICLAESSLSRINPFEIDTCHRDDGKLGLMYDTIEHVTYTFKPPPGFAWNDLTSYVPLEGRGRALVFPVLKEETNQKCVFLHNPSQNSWEHISDNYSALTDRGNYFHTVHAVSNGILYLLDDFKRDDYNISALSAYDINNGRKLFRKKIPISVTAGNSTSTKWLVPVSDSMLCLMWDNDLAYPSYAKILVTWNPPTVRVVDERCFNIDGRICLNNCLPFDCDEFQDLNKHISDAIDSKEMVLELYWKKCCRHLLEENSLLQEEVKELRAHNKQPLTRIKIDVASHAPLLSKEKSILIHVSRVAGLAEAEGYEALELQFQKFKNRTHQYYEYEMRKPNIPMTDSWFIIEHTETGPQISEIFHNVSQDQPNSYCKGSSSAIVGTSLYVIGGKYSFAGYVNYSNQIRRLDFQNPSQGWKTNKLPFYFSDGYVEVVDNFIYLLSHLPLQLKAKEEESCDNQCPWGLIYDTIKQHARPLDLPLGYNYQKAFGFHLSGHGIVVPLGKDWKPTEHDNLSLGYDSDDNLRQQNPVDPNYQDDVFLHNPHNNSWEPLDSYIDFPGGINTYIVSNEILFLFSQFKREGSMTLYAYEYNASSAKWLDLLFEVELPKFNGMDLSSYSVSVVEVADFTFYLLGHDNNADRPFNIGPLFYAKVLISLDPHPIVSILEEACFHMEAVEVLNYLPFDSDLYPKEVEDSSFLVKQNDGNSLSPNSTEAKAMEESNAFSNNQIEKERYWKKSFEKLMADNRKLQKEMHELKGAQPIFQQHKRNYWSGSNDEISLFRRKSNVLFEKVLKMTQPYHLLLRARNITRYLR